MDLGNDCVYALGDEAFQDLSQSAGPLRVGEDAVAMFGDCRIDEVKDRLRSVGFPRVAWRGGHGGGYREDRALRVRCRDSLEDPDNVVNDRRAAYFCELLKQRERKGGEFRRDIAGCVGGNFQVPGDHGSDARRPAEGLVPLGRGSCGWP